MTQQELNQGIDYLKTQIKKLGILPNQILMRANAFTDSLSKYLGWSDKDSRFFLGLLLTNHYLNMDCHLFLVLSEHGYDGINENAALLIQLSELIPFNPRTDVKDRNATFYHLWDIIGNDKEVNPYYVDGPTFFNVAKKFISGLPPTYSQYDKELKEQEGKPITRSVWGKILFNKIAANEIKPFLNILSDEINKRFVHQTERDIDIDLDLEEPTIPIDNRNLVFAKMQPEQKTPKIFISHNTKDGPYAKALVDMLVLLGINEEEDIFCSSLPGCGVKFGDDFIKAIRDQYENHRLIVLFIHSPRYYSSHISLCEMGASWILKYEYRSFLTADCEFGLLDAVVPPTETAYKAGQDNTYHLLNDFKEFIEKTFDLKPKSQNRWDTIRKDFIDFTSAFIPKD